MSIIKFVPHFFTLFSLFLGFSSILASIQAVNNLYSHIINPSLGEAQPQEFLRLAGFFIIMCTFLDFMDGFSARLLRSTSEMGKQLDSLVDLVCFGIAPGVLFYTITMIAGKYIQTGLIYQVSGVVPDYVLSKRLLLQLLAFLFPICAVIRLAKFNLKKGVPYFEGAPSTYAGGVLALILSFNFYPALFPYHFFEGEGFILDSLLGGLFSNYFFLLFIYIFLAILMLTPIRFYKLRYLLKPVLRKRYFFVIVLFGVLLILSFKYMLLFFSVMYFLLSMLRYMKDLYCERREV